MSKLPTKEQLVKASAKAKADDTVARIKEARQRTEERTKKAYAKK